MKFDVLTIFPDICTSYCNESILKRAQDAGSITIQTHNLRDYTVDKHKKVDDTPYGGGAGMVLKVDPIYRAVEDIKKQSASEMIIASELVDRANNTSAKSVRTILLAAKGKRFTQVDAQRLAKYSQLIFICGRYEGVDERVREHIADEEISIGDFVLTGGELPAMIIIDAVARLLPGVLGNDQSAIDESHSQEGQVEYPHYTKPEEFMGWKVPEVLLSGHHDNIEKWRKQMSEVSHGA